MKTYFCGEWLTNVKYKLWVAKTKAKTVAKCILNVIFRYPIWVAMH